MVTEKMLVHRAKKKSNKYESNAADNISLRDNPNYFDNEMTITRQIAVNR